MDNLLLAKIAVDTDSQVTIWGVSLIALAASIAIRVAWASRRGDTDLRTIIGKAMAGAWVAPALAIVTAVAFQSGGSLTPRQAPEIDYEARSTNTRVVIDGHNWTRQTLVENDETGRPILRTPIASTPHSTLDDARREALDLAARRLKHEVERVYGRAGDWELPGELLETQRFITDETTTTRPYKLSALAPSSDMFHCVVRLEISDASREWAARHWKQRVGTSRLRTIATITALLCLLVITTHLYLRLDVASAGTHRGKLQLAALAAVAASGLAASTILSA